MPERVVAFALGACLLQALGETAQKGALRRAVAGSRGRGRARALWAAGLALSLGGAAFAVEALGRGEMLLVSPVLAATSGLAALFGTLILRERLTPRELAGLVALLGGLVVLALAEGAPRARDREAAGGLAALAPTAGLVVAVGAAVGGRLLAAALAAGVALGVGSALLKEATLHCDACAAGFTLADPRAWTALAGRGETAVGVLAQGVGVGLTQVAFYFGRVSLVVPLRSVATVAVTTAVAVTHFGERLDGVRAVAIGALVLGIVAIGGASRHARADSVPFDEEERHGGARERS